MRHRALVLALGLSLAGAAAGQEVNGDLIEGLQAWRAGDFTAARQHWQQASEAGDARAKFLLSELYARGEGGDPDPSLALALLRESAEAGYPVACFNLGNHYLQGEGVSADASQAAHWFRRAAVQGLVQAQYNLGTLYYQGRGVPQDVEQAVLWYRQAAEQGSARAQQALELLGVPLQAEQPAAVAGQGGAENGGRDAVPPDAPSVAAATTPGTRPEPEPAAQPEPEPAARPEPVPEPAPPSPPPPGPPPRHGVSPGVRAALSELQSLALGPDWLRRQPADYYTVQVFASDDADSVARFLRQYRFDRQVAVYPFRRNGQTWYGVVYGRFTTAGGARRAIADLPRGVRQDRPWVRELGDLVDVIEPLGDN